VAETVAEEFAPAARVGERLLEVEDAGGLRVLGDEQRVLQIGRVLVENAIRHTPGGTSIRVAAGVHGGRPALVVEDDAGGIPAEHAAHVFDRFYRADASTASGSGLGLAIARELAELMGGTIALDSGAGRTRFRLVLPAAEGSVLAEEPAEALAR
jgi:signal transduction histidine kinase